MSTKREESKREWTGSNTESSINCGSLQRIADAAERMAQNYLRMQTNLEYYKQLNVGLKKRLNTEQRRNAALRGLVKKLKRK